MSLRRVRTLMRHPLGQVSSTAHVAVVPANQLEALHAAHAVQVPGLPADRLATLDAADRMRLEAEREAALKAEAEQRKVGPSCGALLLPRKAEATSFSGAPLLVFSLILHMVHAWRSNAVMLAAF